MSGSESDSFLSADEENYISSPNSKSNSPVKKSSTKEKSQQEVKEKCEKADDETAKQTSLADKNEGKISKDFKNAAQKVEDHSDIKPDEGDGWDDFDDWDDDKGEASEFSASSGSSPAKSNPNDSAKSELSSQNQKSHQNISSTYDTFPVLNDLHDDKNKRNASIKPNFEEENLQRNETRMTETTTDSSWGWKPWGGVVSFLSNATEGVTTLTSQVSQGLFSVMESGIGVPEPEEMARLRAEEEKKKKDAAETDDKLDAQDKVLAKKDSKDDLFRSSVGNILTGVTQIGNKVITGGLDTLEGIGKKTMTILQENDPLLLNKRKLLGLDNDKPSLSHILREAKEKSEETEKNLKQIQKNAYKKQLHFEMLFDHYHGLVHLEALEMLSKQSSLKLQSLLEPLSGKALAEMQETLNEVKELCDLGDLENEENDGLGDVEELKKKLTTASEDLGVQVDFGELIKCWQDNSTALGELENVEPQEIYNKALRCLAETTALIVSKMHKMAELLLIKDHHSTANEADSLVQLTTVFCWHLRGVANIFGAKLNSYEMNEETSSLITSIFLEESNSSSYVKSAFQLFIPILQIGAA